MYDQGRGKKEARDFVVDVEKRQAGTLTVNAQTRTEAEIKAKEAAAGKGKEVAWQDPIVHITETREAGW